MGVQLTGWCGVWALVWILLLLLIVVTVPCKDAPVLCSEGEVLCCHMCLRVLTQCCVQNVSDPEQHCACLAVLEAETFLALPDVGICVGDAT
eukprot:3485604-Rhodomonas_salina.1